MYKRQVYVYDAETVDYDNTVTTSLEEAGYNSDEYSYEVGSGLPGIRYPAAIIFNADEKPEFVIPEMCIRDSIEG